MKYAKYLRCLYYIGKCSKYLYCLKKALCLCAFVVTALIGISIFSKGNGKMLKGWL